MNTRKAVISAVLIMLQATAVGLAVNALSPHPLPWVRVPPNMTRNVAKSETVLGLEAGQTAVGKSKLPDKKDKDARKVPPVEAQKPTLANEHPESATGMVVEKKEPPVAATTQKPSGASEASSRSVEKSKSAQKPRKQVASVVPKPKKVEALFTTLADAKVLFDRKGAIFIDSRHKEDYELEHIPGAVWLFVEDVDKLYDEVLGSVPKDRTLITYCSDPQCGSAIKLADELVARGHTRVFILLEGLPGWKEAGYPTEGSSVAD